MPIRHALGGGRLCDFFLLVRSVLNTYNSGSPYVAMEEWNGEPCEECGRRMDDESRGRCERCDSHVCNECGSDCAECCHYFCPNCLQRCEPL